VAVVDYICLAGIERQVGGRHTGWRNALAQERFHQTGTFQLAGSEHAAFTAAGNANVFSLQKAALQPHLERRLAHSHRLTQFLCRHAGVRRLCRFRGVRIGHTGLFP
jgi:hypothetical protein